MKYTMAHMTETEREEYLNLLFKYALDVEQNDRRNNVVYNFMRVLWGRGESYDGGECFRYVLDDMSERCAREIAPYAVYCIHFCPDYRVFKEMCLGLKCAFLDGRVYALQEYC